jgi:hypothetical protein
VPFQPARAGIERANDALSGRMPVLITPITTPAPGRVALRGYEQ